MKTNRKLERIESRIAKREARCQVKPAAPAHTAAPWSHDAAVHGAHYAASAIAKTIVHDEASNQRHTEEEAANEALILAAPELLAALEDVCRNYTEKWAGINGGGIPDSVKRAEAVIAKALKK